jgi:DNA-binding beta-propeller fold protein YncE
MKRLSSLIAGVAITFLATTGGALGEENHATYHQIALIAVPGSPLNSFDISWVDRSSHAYYLSDRSNKGVDIFDTRTNTFVARITGFVGPSTSNDTAGPNGIVPVRDRHELWAGDGDSTVKVIDLMTRTVVASIQTGGANRADELAYDPRDHVLIVANDAESVPFVTFIDTRSRTVLGKVEIPDATNGLEQPVWDPESRLFYLSVPRLGGDPRNGGVAVFDPRARSLLRIFAVTDCEPAGLALGPEQQLLLGCSGDGIAGWTAQLQVMDAETGAIVKVITGIGGSDEVWFNPGDHHYYVAARNNPGGPVLGVIDAERNVLIQSVPTGPNSHSVAADPKTNHIFVPLKGKGIGIYAAASGSDDEESDGDAN